jgi:tetratricopeptide (TPR) repeat protein
MSYTTASEAFEAACALRTRGESSAALSVIHQAEQLVTEQDMLLRVRIATERAILEMLTGSPQRALTALNWVLAEANSERVDALLAEHPGLDWYMARAFIIFGDAGLRLEHVHAAKLLDAVERGHHYLRHIGRLDWRDGLLNIHAQILSDMGKHDEAVPLLREAVEISRTSGSGSPGLTYASYLRGLAETLRELERYDEAADVLQTILDDTSASKLDRLGAHVMLGHIAVKKKDYDRTLMHGARAWDLAAGMFDKQRAIVKGLIFEAHKGLANWELARETADDELRLARRAGVSSILCGALQDMLDVLLLEGALDEAEPLLLEAEALATSVDSRTDRTIYTDRIAERRELFDSCRRGGA